MKKNNMLWLLLLLLVGCSNQGSKGGKENTLLNQDTLIVHEMMVVTDTIYIHDVMDDSCVSKQYYSAIYQIERGDNFEPSDDSDNYFYYRLVFSAEEEQNQLYVEKYEIVFDGIFDLKSRVLLRPSMLTHEMLYPNIAFVKWQSPQVVKLCLEDKAFLVNLDTIR